MQLALNFQWEPHEKLLIERKKNYTIRPGDQSGLYPENSVVWITVGKKFQTKRKLYTAFIDRVKVKRILDLTKDDLGHQNPEITTIEELITFLNQVYQQNITEDDMVTVISFSEVIGN